MTLVHVLYTGSSIISSHIVELVYATKIFNRLMRPELHNGLSFRYTVSSRFFNFMKSTTETAAYF